MRVGWIKLHKSLIDWAWYSDPNTKAVFLHLLLTANFEPSEYMGERIERGESVFGRKELGAILGLSEQQVRTAIDHLKSTKEVTIRATKKYSVATLVNYSKYQDCAVTSNQDDNQDGNTKLASSQHEINSKITTSKKKEGKKEEEYPPVVSNDTTSPKGGRPKLLDELMEEVDKHTCNPALRQVIADWIAMRSAKGKKFAVNTVQALRLNLNKAKAYSSEAVQIKAFEYAIANNHQSLFYDEAKQQPPPQNNSAAQGMRRMGT